MTIRVEVSNMLRPAMKREPSGATESTLEMLVTVRLRRMPAEAVS